MRPPRRPIHAVSTWVRRQPPKVKAFLAVVSGMAALVLLRAIVHDHDNLFVAAEAVHSIGISVLIYKLMKEKTCAGTIPICLFVFAYICCGLLRVYMGFLEDEEKIFSL
ncbi:ER lumen -retaining receptor [Olea europaea subsp. europaea]|uniref:ER lumen -retaining receptor n=1 Tax=Olea europaea subsp. europaea TaxID=158383 RepID=A0A8S0SBT3_OLEEU|nr:ER lumen -retaining receptor [Olea europaea subsp. europaea]